MYKTASAFSQRLTRRGGPVSTPALARVNYMSTSGQTRLAKNLDRGAEARLAAERETYEANKGEVRLIRRNSPEGRRLEQDRRRRRWN
jgi:hypothetical protein